MGGNANVWEPLTVGQHIVTNYQAIRDYTGLETILYAKGNTTVEDGGEDFFQKFTGAAAGTYVDDADITLVPTGGDGSTGWVRNATVKNKFTASAISGVRCEKATGFLPANPGQPFSFSSEVFDTDAYHDTVTNPDRFTIPADVLYVEITAGVIPTLASAGTGYAFMLVLAHYNSSDVIQHTYAQPAYFPSAYYTVWDEAGAHFDIYSTSCQLNTGLVNVSAGDYFKLIFMPDTTLAATSADYQQLFFSLRGYKG